MSKILVIGESCLDVFYYCDALRLAPDIPVPVLNVKYKNENGGMAMNVFNNIKSLTDQVDIITNVNWKDIKKSRYVDEVTNHTFFRVDEEKEYSKFDIKSISCDYDIIVISDYNKGYLTDSDIENICSIHPTVFLDTKRKLNSWSEKAKYIKINEVEYKNSEENITSVYDNKIIRTLGSNGCEFNGKLFSVNKSEVKDSSGAGDSFLAALVVKYAATKNIESSINFANKCASETVKHRGVTTI